MKILKIFGIVVGIHVFALVLIFANPGCSSSSKTPPAAAETVAKAETPAGIVVPSTAPAADAVPAGFNPDAPATAAAGGGIRFTPTRPNTPAASTLVAEPVHDVTPMTTYTVKGGDSLWTIANKNKLTYQELAAANNLKSNAVLKPGQKLVIPGKGPAPSVSSVTPAIVAADAPKTGAAAVEATKSTALHHTVKSGDTLGSIALKYGVRPRDLAVANNITDPTKLQLGKDLIIPGWDAASGKSAKSGKASSKSGPEKAATPAPQPDQPPVIAPQPQPQFEIPVIKPTQP
jgi:LysM repeat protein